MTRIAFTCQMNPRTLTLSGVDTSQPEGEDHGGVSSASTIRKHTRDCH